jgi:hypothetical protein
MKSTINPFANLQIAALCGTEISTDRRFNLQYINAFPDARERYPLADYAELITGGSTIPFVTWLNENGKTRPITSCLVEDMAEVGNLLSYLWTRASHRCKGIGRAHLKSVLAQMEARKPGSVMFIEVEDPELDGLEPSERDIRRRRLAWYVREFGAQRWSGKYTMPSLRDPNEEGVEGILLAVADRQIEDIEFLDAAVHILTASYEVPVDHRYVQLLESQRV